MKIAFIGGAHMDHMGKLAGEAVLGASNQGNLTTMPGGAGLNTARVVAMLGCQAIVLGPVGDDNQGEEIRLLLARCGIGDGLVSVPEGRTGSYTSIIGADGRVVVAMADLALNEKMDARWLQDNCNKTLEAADMWFLTSNLSRSAIGELVEISNVPVAATTISVSKAIRLRGVLDKLEILFTNKAEAQSLLRSEDDDCRALAKSLMERGVKSGVVSNGAGRLGFWNGGQVFQLDLPAVDNVVDVTGAGDGLAGTVLAGIAKGHDFKTAVEFGVKAGAQTIKVSTPVLEKLNWEMLK